MKQKSTVRELLGERKPRGSITPESVMATTINCLKWLENREATEVADLRQLKTIYSEACRSYYTLAAVSRRKKLAEDIRKKMLGNLYVFRSQLENKITDDLMLLTNKKLLWSTATDRSFFGVSAKQGVSIRYALSSCRPTVLCGGRCYAHDGRDRELHLIFRGVYNYFIGKSYECAGAEQRREIMRKLSRSIDHAIKASRQDQQAAVQAGFSREARIRFAHIGEMAATPQFTNDLAAEIRKRDSEVACIIYTRHPWAVRLDPKVLRINFTIDSDDESRRRFVPPVSRVVRSAWDGKVSADVEVNFLEHHVDKNIQAEGVGQVCPVTVDHKSFPSCDSASCDLCFASINPSANDQKLKVL